MTLVVLAILLGLVAGLVPGPFSALIASTAIEQGLVAGVEVALVPLATETPIMLLTALVLHTLPLGFLRWVGIVGGVLLAFLAFRIYRRASSDEPETVRKVGKRRLLKPALVGVLSPNPWLFWLLIGSPLILKAWYVSWPLGVATWAAYFGTFMGTQLLIAWLAGHGHKKLSEHGRRRTMRGMSVVLLMAGCVLIWQSYLGNFDDMFRRQQAIERVIEERGNR